MTKEQLKRYREWKLELDEINDEINEKCIKGSVQGSMIDYPYILQNHKIGGIADADYGLLERKAEIKAQIKEIEDFLNSIHNYRIKKAIQIYYIDDIESGEDKPTWEDVADKMGGGQSSEAIKKMVTRYLQN